MKPPAPLTPADRERVHRLVVGDALIGRLDVQLGTAATVAWMKPLLQTWGVTAHVDEGPFPEYAIRVRRVPNGYDAEIVRGDVPLRAGRLVWNELANRSVGAALALRRASHEANREPRPGEQTSLAL